MKNKWRYASYRRMRTYQERRANCLYKEDGQRVKWGRACRNNKALDPWSLEDQHHYEKSWKKRRKTQYWSNARKQTEHFLFIPYYYPGNGYGDIWQLEGYFKDHNIPYRLKCVYNSYTRSYRPFKWVCQPSTKIPNISPVDGRQRGFIDKGAHIKVYSDEVKTYKVKDHLGWNLTWWSNKNIGIEKMLTPRY